MNTINKLLYNKYINGNNKWYPILGIYYLTYFCNFRCFYCSSGYGEPYYTLHNKISRGKDVISILKKIRQYCDYIVITGGEPLNHPDFKQALTGLNKLNFKNVILTTKGYELDKYLSQISSTVHSLVFSVDTLNPKKADNIYGIGDGAFRKIFENINNAANYSNRKFEIVICSVITPDNFDDLYSIYSYTQKNGFVFSACPQLFGLKVHNQLEKSSDYINFYNFLIKEKLKGEKIFGTLLYLKYMRDFRKFTCRPLTLLSVSPTGEVFYPCFENGSKIRNITNEIDLHELRLRGNEIYKSQKLCDNSCYCSNALGFALALSYPWSVYSEIFEKFRSFYNKLKVA